MKRGYCFLDDSYLELAIVKAVVDVLRGTIQRKTKGKEPESIFNIRFPVDMTLELSS